MGMNSAGMGKLTFFDQTPNHKLKLWYPTHVGLNLQGGLRIGHSEPVLPPAVSPIPSYHLPVGVILISHFFLAPQMQFLNLEFLNGQQSHGSTLNTRQAKSFPQITTWAECFNHNGKDNRAQKLSYIFVWSKAELEAWKAHPKRFQ